MMLLTQKYLRDGGSIEQLAAEYALYVTPSRTYPELVQLLYNQIESPFGEALTRECRGLILNRTNWDVVCYPFSKFFNHGEGHAATIDWETAKVQEKVDGSLLTMYYYGGKWNVCTNGTPDAYGTLPKGLSTVETFSELFWGIFQNMGYILPNTTSVNVMFELTSPYNNVVIPYPDMKLTLLGCRDLTTMREIPTEDVNRKLGTNYLPVKTYSFNSFDEVLTSFSTLPTLEYEGYVVVDERFNRVKIKDPRYILRHRLMTGFNIRSAADAVRTGEASEILTYFPVWKEHFDLLEEKYANLIAKVEATYTSLKHLTDRKAFAVEAIKTPYSDVLFKLFSNPDMSISDYYKKVHIDSFLRALNVSNYQISNF